MATVHPSRLRLVPQEPPPRPSSPPSREEILRRQLIERRRGQEVKVEPGRDAERVKEYEHDREADRRRASRRSRSRSMSRERFESRDDMRRRDGSGDRRNGSGPRGQVSSTRNYRDNRMRSPISAQERPDDRSRRPSPSYKAYNGPPARTQDESFIPLNGGNGPDLSRYGYGGNRNDLGPQPGPPPMRGGWHGGPARLGFGGINNLEERRQRREASTVSVWPPSPKEPYKDEDELEAERKARRKADRAARRTKRSKRHRRYSDESSSDTDSEEEERRRRRRHKERERERRAKTAEQDSDTEERDRRRKSRSKSKSKPRTKEVEEELWVERDDRATSSPAASVGAKSGLAGTRHPGEEEEDGPEVGPQLPQDLSHRERKDRAAYSHMLKGEGEAIAAYVASGERIPRRGEIGLDSTTIDAFEQAGYVMSGNRHKRMNAVRMRKENQVINAEEKRAILKLQREEKEKKEGAILMGFKEMMDESLRRQGLNKG